MKDTLEAAQSDAEHQVAEKLKRKAQYVEKLEVMFKAIDETGNGMITEERLNQLLCNPTVRAYLETLDLAVPEGTALFHILDNGDGEVTLEDPCQGPARAIDQVALHADIRQLDHKLAVAVQLLSDWERSPDRSGTQSIDTSIGRLDSRKSKVDGVCSLADVLSRQRKVRPQLDGWLNQKDAAMWLSAVDSLAFSLDASEVEDAFLTVLSAQAPRATKRSRRSVKMLSFLALFGFTGLAAAGTIHQRGSKTLAAGSFLKPVEYEHTLRVCNAYPGTERFQVEMAGVSIMTGAPMGYKECQQLNLTKPLMPGDRLDFRADSLPAATFTVDSLPKYNAVMYVVVHRRGSTADAVSFQSHMFSTAKTPTDCC
eukprot:s97_g2.t1